MAFENATERFNWIPRQGFDLRMVSHQAQSDFLARFNIKLFSDLLGEDNLHLGRCFYDNHFALPFSEDVKGRHKLFPAAALGQTLTGSQLSSNRKGQVQVLLGVALKEGLCRALLPRATSRSRSIRKVVSRIRSFPTYPAAAGLPVSRALCDRAPRG